MTPPRKALEFIQKLRFKHGPDSGATVEQNESKLRQVMVSKNDPESKVARGSRQVEANKLADELRKQRRGY